MRLTRTIAVALLAVSHPSLGLVAPTARTRDRLSRVLFSSDPSLGCWLPVGGVSALQDLTPTKVKIANKDYVVWREDGSGTWSVQVDACPHRLAPLSQGRVDEKTGCIECPYHGWQFDTDGGCTDVPQMEGGGDYSRRSGLGVETLKTHVTGDLLWAFFKSDITGEMFDSSVLPEEHYPVLARDDDTKYFVRELPYSFDFLVENFMDPAHIPFAHHSLQGVRTDGSPIDMAVVANNFTHCEVSFKDVIRGKEREGVVSMQRPCYYHFRTKGDSGGFSENLKIFIAPVAHGRCRVMFGSPLSIGFLPTWLVHAASNRFLNTDAWLHDAERFARREGGKLKYKAPTTSDMGPTVFRQWWQKQGMAAAPPHTFGPAPFSDLPQQSRRQQIDVWEGHSKHCSECRAGLKKLKRLQKLGMVAAVWGTVLGSKIRGLWGGAAGIALGSLGLLVNLFARKCAAIIEGEVAPSGIADRSAAALAPSKEVKAA
mmetsp:Transcript_6512/g.13536  ORF Transcript_6512/g.13536 Transcript_6512/m.13536 type:complete len:484 (-) Transcript_6512:137-1588(-)